LQIEPGSWAKWRRAKSHFETLRDKLAAVSEEKTPFGWTKRYRATPEAHRDGLEYRFYVDPVEIDTSEWALIAGDCFFNLRSALDHLAFELHVRAFRGNVPDAIAEKSAFPLLIDRPTGNRGRSVNPAKWPEIKALGYKQRRAIAWLQPYNRRNDHLRNIRQSLGQIATLNNVDKHRHLNVLQAAALMAGVAWFGDPPGYGFRQDSFLEKPLIGKTEVFRWTFDTAPPDIARYLNGNNSIRAYICLYERGKARLLLSLLTGAIDAVEVVLKRFEVFLPRG
jgi:hypothetical protein